VIALLDSDAVIDFVRGRIESVQLIDSLYSQGLAVSVITVGEVVDGIERSRNPGAGHLQFDRFLSTITVLPIELNTARRFGQLRAGLARSGSPLADADLLIAATAIENNLALVTGNARHFARISELNLISLPRPIR
jgi:predicted nucleic acid-binding protein